MGRWSKNRKAVSQIIVMTEEGDPALIFELENGKLQPGGSKILGTPGYGQLNNNPLKNRTERPSKRGRQSNNLIFEKSISNSQSQDISKTTLKHELNQSIKALQVHQCQLKEENTKKNSYLSTNQIFPIRSIYSPPPPLSIPDENNRLFTLSTLQNLTYSNTSQKIQNPKNNNEIVVSMQEADLEPIQFYAEDNAFDFEFLKQDNFLQITDMRPTLFNEIDPLAGSIPEFEYLYN